MRKGGQKAKGSAFELAIARILTEAYYSQGDGEFRRVPASGGWDKRTAPGDLIPFKYTNGGMVIDKSFPFVVECKNWRDVKHFFSGLYSKESQLFDWMEQAVADAQFVGKMPLVIFKLYRQENVVILQSGDFWKLESLFGTPGAQYYELKRFVPKTGRSGLVFILLGDFLRWLDWEIYKLKSNVVFIRSIVRKEAKNG